MEKERFKIAVEEDFADIFGCTQNSYGLIICEDDGSDKVTISFSSTNMNLIQFFAIVESFKQNVL